MEKVKVKLRYISIILMMCAVCTPSFAIWKVVIDPHCLKAVSTNLPPKRRLRGSIITAWIPSLPRRKNWNYIP